MSKFKQLVTLTTLETIAFVGLGLLATIAFMVLHMFLDSLIPLPID